VTPRLLNADWNFWPERRAVDGIWAASKELGFDGIELGVYDPAEQLSDRLVGTYRSLVDEHQLPVGAVLYSMPPRRWTSGGLGDPDSAARAIDQAVETARIGRDAFGVAVLGVWPGADTLDRGTRPRETWPVFVRSVRTIVERVADLGMRVGVEYKPLDILANVHAALRLCDAVDDAAMGVLVDTGHALWAGEDMEVVVHLCGDRLVHCHLGDTPGAVEADLPPGWHHDFTRLIGALDAAGYDGAMALDMYGAIDQGILGSQKASRFGRDTIMAAAARARGER
jgi:sugar phosphate isomerase/epimerase